MNPIFQKMMTDAISNVLETMFFLAPGLMEIHGAQAPKGRPFVLESTITIADDKAECLKLIFRATRSFASMITANFLGVGEAAVTVDQMEDTVKEFTNMVGGDLLARMPSGNCQLGIPQLKPMQADAVEPAEPNPCSVVLSLDEEPLAVVHLVAGNHRQLSDQDCQRGPG